MTQQLWKRLAAPAVLLCFLATGAPAAGAAEEGDQAVAAIEQGDVNDQGTAFTLHALRDCTFILNTVEGVWEDGRPRLGKELDLRKMRKGETYTFRVMMTENLPPLCVTAEVGMGAELWCPAISGKDGSLLTAPGFRMR